MHAVNYFTFRSLALPLLETAAENAETIRHLCPTEELARLADRVSRDLDRMRELAAEHGFQPDDFLWGFPHEIPAYV